MRQIIISPEALPIADAVSGIAGGSAQMPGYIQPRSISVGGRRTTIRLEEEYWDELSRISADKGVSIQAIVTSIDTLAPRNLTSAIRVFVLRSVLLRRAAEEAPGAIVRRRRRDGTGKSSQ